MGVILTIMIAVGFVIVGSYLIQTYKNRKKLDNAILEITNINMNKLSFIEFQNYLNDGGGAIYYNGQLIAFAYVEERQDRLTKLSLWIPLMLEGDFPNLCLNFEKTITFTSPNTLLKSKIKENIRNYYECKFLDLSKFKHEKSVLELGLAGTTCQEIIKITENRIAVIELEIKRIYNFLHYRGLGFLVEEEKTI